MNVHYLIHSPGEGLGAMEAWFVARGHRLSRTRLYAGERLPDVRRLDWLVIMGGPMGVYEEQAHPWLREEKGFIRRALERDLPVLGVCLGAQLLAEALGGTVSPHRHREIGWFPVTLTEQGAAHPLFAGLPRRFTPLHWHGDSFSIPPGAVHLARSEACENQAFAYGDKVLGLQFHIEALPSLVEFFWEADQEDLEPGPYVQSGGEILGDPTRCSAVHPLMTTLLERLEARARSSC